MARIIEYTARFQREIRATTYYIAHVLMNPVAAREISLELDKAVEFVSLFPRAGTPYHSGKRRKLYYFVNVGNYLAFYDITGNKIVFRRFLHARSDLNSRL